MPNPALSVFQSLTWRQKVIPTRLTLAPINTGFARHGRPSLGLLRFHRDRSGPGIGISVLGNVSIDPIAVPNPRTAVLSPDTPVGRFAAIARAIHDRGSLAGIQLAYSPAGLAPGRRWKNPNPHAEMGRLRSLVTDTAARAMDLILRSFLTSARLAVRAGYDVIQVHAAHGYLLSLFMNSIVNLRLDRYAVTATWIEKFAHDLRSEIGDALFSIRLSLIYGLTPVDQEVEATQVLVSRLVRAGLDIADFSAGLYSIDRRLIYPNISHGCLPQYSTARNLFSDYPCLITICGNVTDVHLLPSDLPANFLISVGRALIADPAFAAKSMNGHSDTIVPCARTGHCHYFSRGLPAIECGVNPYLSRGIYRQ